MYPYHNGEKKKTIYFWKSIPITINFIIFILIYIWLCKFVHYAKDEDNKRAKYIIANRLDLYEEGEFCKEKYFDFMNNGLYETFDLNISSLKKWAIAEIVLIPLFLIFCGISFKIIWVAVFSTITLLLIIIFAIIFAVKFSKCNFDEFTEFSKCRYLNKKFREDYDFIYSIKDGFKTPLYFIILIEFTSCVSSIMDVEPPK